MDVGVIGVGLIGGSIALAAQNAGHHVTLYEPIATLPPEPFGQMRRAANLRTLAASASLLLIATPISKLLEVGADLAQFVRAGSIVSDLASAKAAFASQLAEVFANRCAYLPSHPMAGSEKSGAGAARADLFAEAVTILSPDFAGAAELATLRTFWESLGSRVVELSVIQHDELIAAVSHLPHLLAAALVHYVCAAYPQALPLAGPGFRDFTRIAGGSPNLWCEIFLANREQLQRQTTVLARSLADFNALLASGDKKRLIAFLDAAKRNRDTLRP